MVSGEASAVLIKSLLTTIALPFRRVNSIMAVNSFAGFIGKWGEKLKN
jgi:hypothetical protein